MDDLSINAMGRGREGRGENFDKIMNVNFLKKN